MNRFLGELLVASVLFGVSAFLGKRATITLDGAQVAFLRFAIGLCFVLLQSAVRRAPLRPKRWDLLLIRGFFGGLAGLLYFVSLAELPVGAATLLNCTSPVFTALFAVLVLREKLPFTRAVALLTAGAGVVLVFYGQGMALGGAYGWQALALLSGVVAGAAVTAIRAARKTDGPWEVFGFFNLVGVATTAPFALAAWTWPSPEAWGYVFALGGLFVCSQLLLTHALGHVEAATAATVTQLTVVTSFAMGYFLDGDPVTWLSLLGGVFTVAGVAWVARLNATVPRP